MTVETSAVSSPVAAEAPSPSVAAANLTDDEILDSAFDAPEDPPAETPDTTDDEPAVDAAPEGDTKTVAAEDTTRQEEKPAEEDDEELLRGPEPENLKRAFKAHPELRDAFYSAKAFRDTIGSVKEARAYKEMFPSIEEAEMAREHAAMLLNLDQLYSTDPDQLFVKLRDGSPEIFEGLVKQIRPVIHSLTPESYRREIGDPVMRDVLGNFRQAAQASQDENLLAAVEIIEEKLGFAAQPQPTQPRNDDPRIAEWERWKAGQAQGQVRAVEAFAYETERGVLEAVAKEIDATLSKVPQTGILPGVMDVVRQQILSEVANELNADRYQTAKHNSYKYSGDTRPEHRNAIVNARLAQAKPRIAPKVAKMLKKLTTTVVEANKAELKRADAQSQRKEVGSGGAAPPMPRPTKIDYRRVSDDDILNAP